MNYLIHFVHIALYPIIKKHISLGPLCYQVVLVKCCWQCYEILLGIGQNLLISHIYVFCFSVHMFLKCYCTSKIFILLSFHFLVCFHVYVKDVTGSSSVSSVVLPVEQKGAAFMGVSASSAAEKCVQLADDL